jgi:hypothetical protein
VQGPGSLPALRTAQARRPDQGSWRPAALRTGRERQVELQREGGAQHEACGMRDSMSTTAWQKHLRCWRRRRLRTAGLEADNDIDEHALRAQVADVLRHAREKETSHSGLAEDGHDVTEEDACGGQRWLGAYADRGRTLPFCGKSGYWPMARRICPRRVNLASPAFA